MKTSQANPIHALSEAIRLLEPIVSAARWNPRTRWLYLRLRDLGRGVIKALYSSRRLSAARLIDQHRRLVQGQPMRRPSSPRERYRISG